MKKKGILIVVSAPSGCGKGTVLSEILKDESFYYSVSAATRQPREGEINGVHYNFMSKEEFENHINNGDMLEYARYCGNYYGTLRNQVDEKLDEGRNVILEIEVQGAAKIRKVRPEAVFIFILPPSVRELRRRLNKRGTESEDVINARVAEAENEIRQSVNYDYIIVNDELADAVDDFKCIVRAEKLKKIYSENIIDEVLENA